MQTHPLVTGSMAAVFAPLRRIQYQAQDDSIFLYHQVGFRFI